ncbi:MAG: hypothetical protein OEY95_00475 [Candidatus Bathyarchaeota archaeon]|nr:hypothetical protein [Candidatus Bathyarchaeota archaeon]
MPFIKMSKKEYLEMLRKTRDDILSMIGMFQKSDPDTKVFQDLLMIVNARIKEVEDEVSKVSKK